MKVAIIGANGRSGSSCVRACLSVGMQVRAGVHTKRHPIDATDNLEIIACDGMDLSSVEHLIEGCDAVISLVGHAKASPQWVQTETIQNVITAMKRQRIRRLISLTGTGVRFPGDSPSYIDRILNTAIRVIDPSRIADGIRHAEIIRASGLDWTIIRVLKLTDVRPVSYSLTSGGPALLFTPRATVAQAVVVLLHGEEYLKKAPVISKRIDR